MDIQFYIKDKIQPWQTDVNDYNWLFGIPKFDYLSYLNFVFSIKYNHSSQLTLQEFTAKKVTIKGGAITLVDDTILDYNDIDVNNNSKSVSYSVNPGVISETLDCGVYIFYLWNDAGEEYYSQPVYIQGGTTGDFNDDFNIDFY